ncbi:C2H2-type domain-containing protein [Salix suchowensis]|nr:C2H2-type domain-containing protein [Salix suchowensis]
MPHPCSFCNESFTTLQGLSQHVRAYTIEVSPSSSSIGQQRHLQNLLHLGLNGLPCSEHGTVLPPGLPPPPQQPADAKPNNPWNPFPDHLSFEFADYHFTTLQSSESQVNQALDLWLAAVVNAGGDPCLMPWQTAKQMYGTIDAIKEGPTPWKTIQFCYTGPLPKGTPPKWMQETYELCFRDPHSILLNQIALPELQDHFDYAPYMQFNAHMIMSGRTLCLATGLGLKHDKTTVSVATGHQEYHPVYIGAGNIHNLMWRSHAHGMEPVALLPIPKSLFSLY